MRLRSMFRAVLARRHALHWRASRPCAPAARRGGIATLASVTRVQYAQVSVVSVHVPACAAPHCVILVGILLFTRMSKVGEPPLKATPPTTTVVACPTTQQGPGAGVPVSVN